MNATGLILPPKILREKLGEDGTEELVQVIGAALDTARKEFVPQSVFEKRLGEMENKILMEIGDIRVEFSKGLGDTRAEFIKSDNQLESRLTWKLIAMWSVQIILLVGILVKLYVR